VCSIRLMDMCIPSILIPCNAELACGFPLWFAYKSRVVARGRNYFPKGLFAAMGRRPAKIYLKQIEFLRNMRSSLATFPGLRLEVDDEAMDLLGRMLERDPAARCTPDEALRHPFLHVPVGTYVWRGQCCVHLHFVTGLVSLQLKWRVKDYRWHPPRLQEVHA
jgi:serine/threonine protein kinase